MAAVTVEIRLNGLPRLGAELRQRAAAIVSKAALDIESLAKQAAPVDTGALRSSISAVTADGGDYAANVSAAAGRNPLAEFAPMPTVESDLQAYVVAPVHYASFQEFGTVHAPAQPFLTPAVEAVRPSLQAAWQALQP